MALEKQDRLRDKTPPPAPEPPAPRPAPRVYWDSSTNGFLHTHYHSEIPEHAVEISLEEWQAVLHEHTTTGKPIITGPNGKPIAVDTVVTRDMKRRSLETQIQALTMAPETLAAQRGALLGKPGAKEQLAAIDAQIEAIRASIPPRE